MTHSIENYDPRKMEEYLKAGRRERAYAFRDLMISLKKSFTKPSQSKPPVSLGRPRTTGAC